MNEEQVYAFIINKGKHLGRACWIAGIFLLLFWVIKNSFYVINPGFSAVHTRLGRIVQAPKVSGYYFKVPGIDTVTPLDLRIRKAVIKTEAFSHDLQTVDIEVAINHRIEDPWLIYKNIGADYERIVIDPFTQESVKAIVAMFTAENLTQNRNKAKEMVNDDLRKALQRVHIHLVDFNFIHADFHHDFIKSVENKQIAEQKAKQAKFETESMRETAIQIQTRAEAEAHALKVQKDAVTPQLTLLKAIEKWNGILPRVVTSSSLINLMDN